MPFQSEAQRRFLWAKHPDIAKRWAHEYAGNSGVSSLARKVLQRRRKRESNSK